jgi:hypothetical protein
MNFFQDFMMFKTEVRIKIARLSHPEMLSKSWVRQETWIFTYSSKKNLTRESIPKMFLISYFVLSKSHGHRVLNLWDMIFLVKRCLAEISGQQHSENGSFAPFSNMMLFNLWIPKLLPRYLSTFCRNLKVTRFLVWEICPKL